MWNCRRFSDKMLRLPPRLKLLSVEGECETAEDDLVSNETLETSQLAKNDNFNAGTDIQDNGESSNSNSSMMNSSAGGHPLLFPEILQHLFQICPASILASCRLVCKLWYEESLLNWRASVPITINTDHDGTGDFVGRVTPLKEFLEFIDKPGSQCSKKPYRSSRIVQGCRCIHARKLKKLLPRRRSRAICDQCEFCLSSEDFKLFWNSIGRNLTTLTLSKCTFRNAEQFRQIIFKFCPILQSLEIDGCYIISTMFLPERESNGLQAGQNTHLKSLRVRLGRLRRHLPVSYIELFSKFPSLTSLECSAPFSSHFPELEFQSLMASIRAIRKNDNSKLRLKHFQIHPYLEISQNPGSNDRFANVKELCLPLKCCAIAMDPEIDMQFLMCTLEYLVPWVNTINVVLHVGQWRGRKDHDLQDQSQLWTPRDFPFGIQLDNVTSLDIRGDLIDTLQFLKYMPNLSKLTISDNGMYLYALCGTKIGRSTEVVSNTCKEEFANLKMLQLTSFCSRFVLGCDEDIQHLFNWMPNITSLEMVLNDKQFGMVCKHWKNLRKLRVLENEDCKLLTNEDVAGISPFGVRPVIANLGSLESLVLENYLPILTPGSVYHLFLLLPNLQTFYQGIKVWNNEEDPVKRGDLDISSYHRALLRCSYYATNVASTPLPVLFYNAVKQWIAENSNAEKEKPTD